MSLIQYENCVFFMISSPSLSQLRLAKQLISDKDSLSVKLCTGMAFNTMQEISNHISKKNTLFPAIRNGDCLETSRGIDTFHPPKLTIRNINSQDAEPLIASGVRQRGEGGGQGYDDFCSFSFSPLSTHIRVF